MRASAFWKAVTVDRSNFLENLVELLETNGVRYCVIGGQGVNAYVEPLVSLDLDLVIAVDQLAQAEALLRAHFDVERFPHSLNVAAPESKLRVQVQTDSRYFPFVERASKRHVLDILLPVAALADILQGKVWAATDETRRPSKRRKDLLDIERILEQYPDLRASVPPEILARLS
ncbi:MAG TPA: nucleotidyl transferase AbiEii/AbiGii toxin family protein [Bryobacteraceae bacterium]|nr:nucleotidyl transferase AbiEii/AbiGii toxin family protein [Bryobacteraceae bacterium]